MRCVLDGPFDGKDGPISGQPINECFYSGEMCGGGGTKCPSQMSYMCSHEMAGHLYCEDGIQQIGSWNWCDGVADCSDGTDETQCPCPPGMKLCKSGDQCVLDFHWQDGYKHCTDNSDEEEEVAENGSYVIGFNELGMEIALHERHVLGKPEHQDIEPWVMPAGDSDKIPKILDDAGFVPYHNDPNHWWKIIPMASLTLETTADGTFYSWCWTFDQTNTEDVEDDRIYNEKFMNEVCFTAQIDLNPVEVASDTHHTVSDKIIPHSQYHEGVPVPLLVTPTYTLRVEESKKLGDRVKIYIDMDQAFPFLDIRAKSCTVQCIDAHCAGEDAVILGSDDNYCVWSFINFEPLQTEKAVRAIYEWDAFKFDNASPETVETHTISCVMEHGLTGTLQPVTYDECSD